MDAQEFLGLTATHNPHRWYLPVTTGLSTMGGFLFGGCGLGAAILGIEGDEAVQRAATRFKAYVSQETLAVKLDICPGGDEETALDGHAFSLTLQPHVRS